MLTIYHSPGRRSVRPIWLCYELELPVAVQLIDCSAAYRASAEWRAISPAGTVPAMRDGELVMVESGVMLDYLLERYGAGRPQPASSVVLVRGVHPAEAARCDACAARAPPPRDPGGRRRAEDRRYPRCRAYLGRLQARPAYQRVAALGQD